METEFALTETAQHALLDFFDSHDIHRFSESLRRLFIDYLDYELRTAVPLYFDTFLYPFNELLDLLDTIACEKQAFSAAKIIPQPTVLHQATTEEKVIAFLAASLSPEKIFLLHHAAREDGTVHFDLLAVIPESAQTNFSAYEQVISMANIEQAGISVSLHKAATLYRQLEEGHIYYSIACHTKNLVYDNGLTVLPGTNKTLLQAAIEKANTAFYSHHKKAAAFLEGAGVYYAAHDINMAAFMLHQSVELVLRGTITALLGSCAKTHCFKELKKPLQRCVPELRYIISKNEAEENRLLHLLEKAYLESRYTDGFDTCDNDIDLLKEAAEKLQGKMKGLFEEKINQIAGG